MGNILKSPLIYPHYLSPFSVIFKPGKRKMFIGRKQINRLAMAFSYFCFILNIIKSEGCNPSFHKGWVKDQPLRLSLAGSTVLATGSILVTGSTVTPHNSIITVQIKWDLQAARNISREAFNYLLLFPTLPTKMLHERNSICFFPLWNHVTIVNNRFPQQYTKSTEMCASIPSLIFPVFFQWQLLVPLLCFSFSQIGNPLGAGGKPFALFHYVNCLMSYTCGGGVGVGVEEEEAEEEGLILLLGSSSLPWGCHCFALARAIKNMP